MSRFEAATEALRQGRPIVLCDERLPSSGCLVAAAETATEETWSVLAADGSEAPSLIFLAAADRVVAKTVELLAGAEEAPRSAEMAARRARFGKAAAAGRETPADGRGLGLGFDRAAPGGVFGRAHVREAAVDAVASAGAASVAVLCRIALPGGILAADDAASAFAAERGLTLLSIQDVAVHRLATETIVERAAAAGLPSLYAERPLEIVAFRSLIDGSEHVALVHGPLGAAPLVRLHSECLTGDALGSLRCDCGDQLRKALKLAAEHEEGGVVLYLRGHEGRGIGLVNKIRAYALQDQGFDTVEANAELGFEPDLRDYGLAVQMLRQLGIGTLRLLTNNPAKVAALSRYGVAVRERVTLRVGPNPHNAHYLETKRAKLGHDLLAQATRRNAPVD